MSEGLADPIPWSYTDLPGVLQWTWVSQHFVASILGQEVVGADMEVGRRHVRTYHWELSDTINRQQGLPRLLVEGGATTFDDAEARIREHVGKAYDRSLGYLGFAGPWAYTFTIATGDVLDVREFIGTLTTAKVLMADRSERTVSGDFSVHHYEFCFTTPSSVFTVVPEHVVRLSNRSEVAERATELTSLRTYTGVGRIYREEVRPGCTGKPGFDVGTVDHAGVPRCQLHEEGLPEHLLR